MCYEFSDGVESASRAIRFHLASLACGPALGEQDLTILDEKCQNSDRMFNQKPCCHVYTESRPSSGFFRVFSRSDFAHHSVNSRKNRAPRHPELLPHDDAVHANTPTATACATPPTRATPRPIPPK
eukprot:2672740-Prymnesium_polylepis.3